MAQIKVNKAKWDAISRDEQNSIQQELRTAGAISEDDEIVGDAGAQPFEESDMTAAAGPCEAACTAAYGRASRACSLLPHPAARAVCYAAAMAAYAVCLRNCK